MGITIEDIIAYKKRHRSSPGDVLIFGKLELVSLDSEGDLMLAISKENKSYLSYVLRLLQEKVGSEVSICIRFKEDRNKHKRYPDLERAE
jgi:hypothetical protein